MANKQFLAYPNQGIPKAGGQSEALPIMAVPYEDPEEKNLCARRMMLREVELQPVGADIYGHRVGGDNDYIVSATLEDGSEAIPVKGTLSRKNLGWLRPAESQ
jgi:hypothetical protein